MFIEAAIRNNWTEEGETVLAHAFNDFISFKGRLAEPNIDPDDVFQFMMRRLAGNFAASYGLLAQPLNS